MNNPVRIGAGRRGRLSARGLDGLRRQPARPAHRHDVGRAVVANPDLLADARPVRAPAACRRRSYRALLVPDAAIVTDQTRKIVYVVDDEGGRAERRSARRDARPGSASCTRAQQPDERYRRRTASPARPTASPAEGARADPTSARTRDAPAQAASRRVQRRAVRRSRHMNISRFFIDRPIFAAVLSIVIDHPRRDRLHALPVAQYPEVVPPTDRRARDVSGRAARGHRGDGRDADRAGDQRRRGHALYLQSQAPSTGSCR